MLSYVAICQGAPQIVRQVRLAMLGIGITRIPPLFVLYSIPHHFFHSLYSSLSTFLPSFLSPPSIPLYFPIVSHSLLSIKGGSGGVTHGLNENGLNLECLRIDQIIFSTILSFVGFQNTTGTLESSVIVLESNGFIKLQSALIPFLIFWFSLTLCCFQKVYLLLIFICCLCLNQNLTRPESIFIATAGTTLDFLCGKFNSVWL